MSDYSLLQAALDVGGRVVRVDDLSRPFEDHARRGGSADRGASSDERGGDPRPLSKVHISPRGEKTAQENPPVVEWVEGASLLKASRGGSNKAPVGGKKGVIAGFSASSRRRLMYTIAKVKRGADLPLFVTLTYPEKFPTAAESKRHLDIFSKRLRRAFPSAAWIWKLEPQQRGAPHYHCLVWGVELDPVREFVPLAWYQVAGDGDIKHLLWHQGKFSHGNTHCVQAVCSWRGVWSYASKYLGKTFEVEGWENTGRYWGIVNRECIPFGETKTQVVTRSKAVEVMRYQKRFAHHGKKVKFAKNKTMTIFCDASQWAQRLEVVTEKT